MLRTCDLGRGLCFHEGLRWSGSQQTLGKGAGLGRQMSWRWPLPVAQHDLNRWPSPGWLEAQAQLQAMGTPLSLDTEEKRPCHAALVRASPDQQGHDRGANDPWS